MTHLMEPMLDPSRAIFRVIMATLFISGVPTSCTQHVTVL